MMKKMDNIHSEEEYRQDQSIRKKKKDPNIGVSLGQSEHVLIPIIFGKCLSV